MTDERARTDLPAETVEKLRKASTATLTTVLLQHGFRNTFLGGIAPLRPDLRMVGRAFTLRYVPSREDHGYESFYDNDTNLQRIAVETIGPGDVLVIDARGEMGCASLGNILATRLHRRGAAGVVTDGAFRDSPRFRKLDLASYARGAHATTSGVYHHPADINVPIGCAGALVIPGDVMVGDAEGVVVVPSAIVDQVAEEAFQQEVLEEFLLGKIERGASVRGVYPPDDATRAEFHRRSANDAGRA